MPMTLSPVQTLQASDACLPRIIGIAGPKTSGKDTAAKWPLARNSVLGDNVFTQVNFADPLKQVCMLIFGLTYEMCYDSYAKEQPIPWMPSHTPRQILQNVAHMFRTMYAEDIWVRAWMRNIMTKHTACIIVTDLRHVEEKEQIRELGGKIIYILNPRVEEERKEGRANGDPRWCDTSEAYAEILRLDADIVVENDGRDLGMLYQGMADAIRELFGDPDTWDLTQFQPGASK